MARAPAPVPVQQPVEQVSQAEKAPPQKLYPVVVAAKKIDAGATLSASMLETRQWPVTPSSGFSSDQAVLGKVVRVALRSEEHTSELQSLMRISYAVFCLKKK